MRLAAVVVNKDKDGKGDPSKSFNPSEIQRAFRDYKRDISSSVQAAENLNGANEVMARYSNQVCNLAAALVAKDVSIRGDATIDDIIRLTRVGKTGVFKALRKLGTQENKSPTHMEILNPVGRPSVYPDGVNSHFKQWLENDSTPVLQKTTEGMIAKYAEFLCGEKKEGEGDGKDEKENDKENDAEKKAEMLQHDCFVDKTGIRRQVHYLLKQYGDGMIKPKRCTYHSRLCERLVSQRSR